jgi:hypothetical protein
MERIGKYSQEKKVDGRGKTIQKDEEINEI